MSAEQELIQKLATEVGALLEHYEEDEAKWWPESVAAARQAKIYLEQRGLEVPEPVLFVIKRADSVRSDQGDPASIERPSSS